MDTNKTCNTCKQSKSLSDFFTRKVNGRSYPQTYCKDCRRDKRRTAIQEGRWKSSDQLPSGVDLPARQRAYRQDPSKRAAHICVDSRKGDKRKGLENDLTTEFVDELISRGCSYCGAEGGNMTLDRKDNDLGHTQANVVPACYRCNIVRGSMPYEAWLLLVPAMRSAYEQGLFGDWRSQPISRK